MASSYVTKDLLDRLNAVCPTGIRFTAIFNAQVNIAAAFNRATYRVTAQGIGDIISEILNPMYSISYQEKGEWVEKNVSGRIFSAERIDGDTALVTLAIGNDNVRADRLVTHLMREHNLTGDYRIIKLAAYVNDTPADEYLSAI